MAYVCGRQNWFLVECCDDSISAYTYALYFNFYLLTAFDKVNTVEC